MRVALVHHSDAESPAVDPQRPLTTRGWAQAAAVADVLNRYAANRPLARAHGEAGYERARQVT